MRAAKAPKFYDFLIDEIISIARLNTYDSWQLTDWSYQDTWVFCYCIGGRCRYEWNGSAHIIGPGDAALFPPGLVRSAKTCSDDPWTSVVAKFRISQMNEAARQMFSVFPVYISQLKKKVTDLFLYCESIWRYRRSTYLIACRSILEEILCRLIEDEKENTLIGVSAHRIKPALRRLENGEDCSAEELAAMTGLSVSHFRMLFKQTTGYTIVQYKNYLRVARARDLLLVRNCTVSEAAEAVGIPDVFYFSRLFKQHFGVPPSQIAK